MTGRWSVLIVMLLAGAAAADGKPVGIAADLPHVDVSLEGKPFRIERNQDNDAEIDPARLPTLLRPAHALGAGRGNHRRTRAPRLSQRSDAPR